MTPFPDMKERFRHSAAFLNMSVVALRNGTNSKVSNAILCSKHLAIRVGSINIVSYRWYWGDSSPRRRPTIIWRKGLKTQCMERRMAGWWKCFWYQGTLSLGINAIYVDLKNCGRRERVVPGLQPTAVVCNLGQAVDFVSSHHTIYSGKSWACSTCAAMCRRIILWAHFARVEMPVQQYRKVMCAVNISKRSTRVRRIWGKSAIVHLTSYFPSRIHWEIWISEWIRRSDQFGIEEKRERRKKIEPREEISGFIALILLLA